MSRHKSEGRWDQGNVLPKHLADFLNGLSLVASVNTTLIVLIPKVSSPCNVKDYYPISCCNVFCTKLCLKLLLTV